MTWAQDSPKLIPQRRKTVTPTTPLIASSPTSSVYTLTYQYDSASNRTRLTYPSGKVVDYTYANNDRMDLVRVNSVTLTDYNYDPLDRRTTKIFTTPGPQQQAAYNFDIANQLEAIHLGHHEIYQDQINRLLFHNLKPQTPILGSPGFIPQISQKLLEGPSDHGFIINN